MYKKKLALAVVAMSVGLGTSLLSTVSNADTVNLKVSNDQAKVIVYRGNTHRFAQSRDAKLYLDGKHIANLGKHDYVEFCTSPDKHTITSHLESVIFYSDKNKKHLTNELNSGNTYVIRINDDENGSGEPLLSGDLNATEQLKDKKQKVAIAENIVECKQYVETSSPVSGSTEEQILHKDGGGSSVKSSPSSELVLPVDTTNTSTTPIIEPAVIVN